jgi:hypothetical protein
MTEEEIELNHLKQIIPLDDAYDFIRHALYSAMKVIAELNKFVKHEDFKNLLNNDADFTDSFKLLNMYFLLMMREE